MFIQRALRHPLTLPFYFPSLLSATSRGLLKLILPLYAAAITESYLVIGIMLAADALGTILGDVLAGMVLGRLGDKRVMQIGLLVIIGSMATLFLVSAIPIVVVTLIVFGVGAVVHSQVSCQFGRPSRRRSAHGFSWMPLNTFCLWPPF